MNHRPLIATALCAMSGLIGAAETAPILHPKGTALPHNHQGPFVTAADGAVGRVHQVGAGSLLRARDARAGLATLAGGGGAAVVVCEALDACIRLEVAPRRAGGGAVGVGEARDARAAG